MSNTSKQKVFEVTTGDEFGANLADQIQTDAPRCHSARSESTPKNAKTVGLTDLLRGPERQFWRKLSENGDCWIWKGTKGRNGYGNVMFGGRHWGAHRLAWHLTAGRDLTEALAPDVQIRHKCDVKLCYNPAHLEPGSAQDNAYDAVDRGRTKGGRPIGSDHGGAVMDIIILRKRGLPVREIATSLGMSERNVYYHLRELKKLAELDGTLSELEARAAGRRS